ncbi:hypothetical protein PGIGA_G00126380 [Pangasianodon gigas]|uniref:Uncharacterized protein n=1 Tax=Pangasianodon gigas TaxID=30993 RepID=A0ACC5XIJ9_PANGG|nr:hypothetical protein [Pangasianodon gigas]
MGLRSHRPVRVPMLTSVHCKGVYNGHVSRRTRPWSDGRRWPGLINYIFFYIILTA